LAATQAGRSTGRLRDAGNGRIESTEVDIATKSAGRVREVLVKEGDFVESGQVVARMDTQTLEAELHQLRATVKQAQSASATAHRDGGAEGTTPRPARWHWSPNGVSASASALADGQPARERSRFCRGSELKRSEELVAKGFITAQRLSGQTRPNWQVASASLAAAQFKTRRGAGSHRSRPSRRRMEMQSAIEASRSQVSESEGHRSKRRWQPTEKIKADIDDATLKAPRGGRVQYRTAEPGEVLPAGGKILTVIDLSDVYMTFFLPETVAGKVTIGAEVRLVLDAMPQYVIPARRFQFVDSAAQFTPKAVETSERAPETGIPEQGTRSIRKSSESTGTQVKTGLPGVAYVRLDAAAPWPPQLQVNLPQ
jgi:HlyD family secretion protein